MKDQSILDKVTIATPCHARWEDMTGDDRARFCGQCNKHVYNFSAMTRAEVVTLIHEKQGRLCGRFYQRRDGRMLTTDCPVGVQRKRNRLARICGAVAGFVLFLLGGCSRREPTPTKQGEVVSPPMMGAPVVMGDVACPPPENTNLPPEIMGRIRMPLNTETPRPAPSLPPTK
jgi:hypothetical protein